MTGPEVHSIWSANTASWQYVVADPATRRCAVIDAVCQRPQDWTHSDQSNAHDPILHLVKTHGYVVEHIFDTYAFLDPASSAAWGLRMRLLDLQGFAPQFDGSLAVSPLHRMYERKYSALHRLQTAFDNGYKDGDRLAMGRMSVIVLHVPTSQSPHGRAYVIGDTVFGAMHLVHPPMMVSSPSSALGGRQRLDVEDDHHLFWRSMNKLLSLDPRVRVYPSEGSDCESGRAQALTIDHCRESNPYAPLASAEFVLRRRGECIAMQQALSTPLRRHRLFGRS